MAKKKRKYTKKKKVKRKVKHAAPSALGDALRRVYNAVKGLSPAERQRVFDAATILLKRRK